MKGLSRLEFLTRLRFPSHRICRLEDHLDGVGDRLANLVGQPNPGLLDQFDLHVGVGHIVGTSQNFVKGPANRGEPTSCQERHGSDFGGKSGRGLDEQGALLVCDFAKVELERGARVPNGAGVWHLLLTMQMAKGDVRKVAREQT